MAAVTLYNPRTGAPHTFPSERSAKVYEDKGWTREQPSAKKSQSSQSSS